MSELNTTFNPGLILLCGNPASGKTYALKGIENPERWLYLNCETGKTLPFRFKDKEKKFREFKVTDPRMVESAFDYAMEESDKVDGIIVDSLTFLMEMFISRNIIGATDSRKGWQEYGEYIRNLLQNKALHWGKPVIFIAHISETFNEELSIKGTKVPLKGQIGDKGVEAYFNSVVYARQVPLTKLKNYIDGNDLLTISEREKMVGYKYVIQTQITKETVGDRIRNPDECFSQAETYIDNNIQHILTRLNEYYS